MYSLLLCAYFVSCLANILNIQMENNVIVSDYQQMDRILKEERKYILKLIKKIVQSGCNVLLIQKSILRDAVNDLSLHYLAKQKIMVVRDIERTDVEFISKVCAILDSSQAILIPLISRKFFFLFRPLVASPSPTSMLLLPSVWDKLSWLRRLAHPPERS